MIAAASESQALLEELRQLGPPEQLERLRAVPDARAALLALGDEAERLALVRVADALAAAEITVRLADAAGGARERARARRALAQALAYAGRHTESLASCSDAVSIATSGGEALEAARARAISLHPLGELGRYDEAVAEGEAARQAFLNAGEPRLAARADFNLGGIHQNRDDPARALYHFDRAAPAFENDPVITGYLQNNRGEALLLLNDFAGAQRAFEAARAACERAGADVAAGIAEGNLADLAARQGRLQLALFHFEHARRRLERVDAQSHLNRLLAEQAEALESLGLADQALEAYAAVLPRLEAQGLAWETARARTGVGRALMRLARLDQAESILAQAASAFAALSQSAPTARVQLMRAALALERGRLSEAEAMLRESAPHLCDRPLDAAALQYHEARLALARSDWATARSAAEIAVRLADELQIAPLQADVRQVRAAVRQRQGDFGGAAEDLCAAVEHVERVRGTLQADHFRAAFLGRRSALYENLVLATLDAGGDSAVERAFTAMEQGKSRSLLDVLSGAIELCGEDEPAAVDAVDSDLRRTSARLRSELNVLYSRLADYRATGRHKLSLAEWRALVRVREQELRATESRLAATQDVDHLRAAPVGLERVRDLLAADAALIEYYVAGDELLALCVRRDSTHVVRGLATPAELADLVQAVRFQMNRTVRTGGLDDGRRARLLRDVNREMHALWRVLIGPLSPALRGVRRVVFVPHGPLHVVPLHALYDGRQYLIESFEVVCAPSASVFATLCERAAGWGGRLGEARRAVFGFADAAAPQIASEAARVAGILGCTPVVGGDATAAAVMDAAPAVQILHFACHGQYSSRLPLASGLKLADRWLTVRDIFGLRLGAELVALSGCNTGRNLVRSGDELVGLLHGFLRAGTASLVVSLWPAHDENTSNLMSEFYRMWLERPRDPWGKAAALRHAQLSALREHSHPAFWAPFVLVGKP